MSQHRIAGKQPGHVVLYGWDRAVDSFYITVLDQDEEPVLMKGTFVSEIPDVPTAFKEWPHDLAVMPDDYFTVIMQDMLAEGKGFAEKNPAIQNLLKRWEESIRK